ncbi:sensor histidine kinase [Desulfovibrio ferrophilus]|uniref:histidine kinase n=1 Tax=Desulfovibrio ferrophilus TaxID=241368 RepID=A0A2Z6AU96_9BACT|nr:histidine kinase dimerization/phosphoacceptor domain -containing protein [Desulfovibrio ferrophilus]BBD06756.1 HAMP domain protein [Desulfovibrio ferrophilus]
MDSTTSDSYQTPPSRSNTHSKLVITLIMALFLALSAFSTLSILHQDRQNQTAQMLTAARGLERVLGRFATPTTDAFRLQAELDNIARRDKRIVRLTLYTTDSNGNYKALASTWPSRLGQPATQTQLQVLQTNESYVDDETVAGHNAFRLSFPVHTETGQILGLLDMLMIAERPATLAAGIYAAAATVFIALLIAYFTHQKQLLNLELHRRLNAEQELTKHRDRLEDSVRERTSDLIRANRLLEREISERGLMADKIKNSLAEKELLLQEIHHRVKNNLQIVASLLDMAGRRAANKEVLDICTELSSKVHGISLVHTQLYQNETIDHIDMGKYAKDLNSYLVRVYNASQIEAHIVADSIHLPIVAATPLGMVLNELLTNSYKHAFNGRKDGNIHITMKQQGPAITIEMRDSGPGIPEGLDPENTDSMGMKLINNIVTYQLMGSITFSTGPGAQAIIEFDKDHFPGRTAGI